MSTKTISRTFVSRDSVLKKICNIKLVVILTILLFLASSQKIPELNEDANVEHILTRATKSVVKLNEYLNLLPFMNIYKKYSCHFIVNNFNHINLEFDNYPVVA